MLDFRSLRFRLPALFVLGVLLAATVATLIAIRFFQDYTRTRAGSELQAESFGIVQLYTRQAGIGQVRVKSLERAIGGDRIFYVPIVPGASLLAGRLPTLPRTAVPLDRLPAAGTMTLDLHTGGEGYLAVAQTVRLGGLPAGALVVAEPDSALRNRWLQLLGELAIAFGIGIPLATLLVVYFSRRLTRPLDALSDAADEVAGGNYAVALPEHAGASEIERLSARFREMTSRLAESEELSRHFLMSVSHELRTPLTAIRGHVSALREGIVEDEEARKRSLEVIAEEGLRLERLVGDVLDLAKLDARRFALLREEVDMHSLCEQAYDAFAEQAREQDISYRRDLADGIVLVTDGDRVLQIVSNLLANAIRATPPGGSVELALEASDGHVTVDVSDTGPGIAAGEQERIFRAFWSGDGGGTGLGLTIARELAVALGGRLELASEPGKGSRFSLVLPLVV